MMTYYYDLTYTVYTYPSPGYTVYTYPSLGFYSINE